MKFARIIVLLCMSFVITSCDDEGMEPLESNTALIGAWESISSTFVMSEGGVVIEQEEEVYETEEQKAYWEFIDKENGTFKEFEDGVWRVDPFTYKTSGNKLFVKLSEVDEEIGNMFGINGDVPLIYSITDDIMTMKMEVSILGTTSKSTVVYKKIKK